MNLNVKMNRVYIPYFDKKQFIQIFFGGSSSGKSYFICQKIVLDNLKGVNWLVCRNVARTIRNSTFNEIVKAIQNMRLSRLYAINKTDMAITNLKNGKQILFVGLEDAEKLKSITPQNGIIERIFIEEATEIKRDAYKQLTKRLRGKSKFSKCIIFAFNPILKSHWIYKEFFKEWDDNQMSFENENLSILKTTYINNDFLTEQDRYLLENEKDPYWRSVYVKGNWGVLGNLIFTNWHVENLRDSIPNFDKIHCGIDFGYSQDPNALVKLHLDKKHKKIYVFDEYYKAGMQDSELLRVCREFFGNQIIFADSAEPKTIDFLNSNGVRTFPAMKGADSINRGIRWLQGYEIILDVKCQNLKNELEQYHWQETKDGIPIDKPVDKENHLIDSMRYALTNEIMAQNAHAVSHGIY